MVDTKEKILVEHNQSQYSELNHFLDEDVSNQQIQSHMLSENIKNEKKIVKFGQRTITLQILATLKIGGCLTIYQIFDRIQDKLTPSNEKKYACLKRRIYDSVNVLVSAGILIKQSKKIRFNNIKGNFLKGKLHQYEKKMSLKQHDLVIKQKEIEKLERQNTLIKHLIDKNISLDLQNGKSKVQLPVLGLMINTSECQIKGDQHNLQIVSSQVPSLYGDIEMLIKCKDQII